MSTEKKDYKDSLNIPFTNFSMKADLPLKEEKFRQKWLDQEIYNKVLQKNKSNKPFILHDGPPYANGSLHMGHAFNKILKDIIVRFRSMQGFYSPYVPGWDTHGLPIENKILEQMAIAHTEIDSVELRKAATKYAASQIEIQKEEFKKLQLLSDLKEYYTTFNPKFEAQQLRLFKRMALNGIIYKGLKPVYWSPSSQSALAEAEVEYLDHTSPSIIVAFKVVQGNKLIEKNDYILIWTTTPWTLIANAGVAFGADFEYARVKVKNEYFILAKALLESVATLSKWENYEIINSFKGNEAIENILYQRPIKKDLTAPAVVSGHVTLESGTGIVHMAPLFGEDDFLIGKKYNLDMIMHIDDDGTISKEGDSFEGLFYQDANKEVGLFLEKEKALLSLKFMKHSYPHDWRTHKPIIYRGTPQFFCSIEKIKKEILTAIDDVKFYNTWSEKRLRQMIENRDDWTISRQRRWGVPIIVFYDENKNLIMQEDIFDYVIDLIEKYGSDIWFEKSTDELLPEQYRNKNWTREMDIMDVWFDSGSTSIGVDIDNVNPPFDMYLEGSDQYRGWFNSSLINSVAWRNKAPYKELLSHGFLVDEKGRKMSKSLGNGVAPLEITSKFGADILRLWVANSEYKNDVSISQNIIMQNVEIYRKLRNTIRFLLGNLHEYKYQEIAVHGINALMIERINNLKNDIIDSYNQYDFVSIIKNINNFIVKTSAFYFSVTKDVLYTNKKTDTERQEILFVFHNILEMLLISLAPILPTTTEEAYDFLEKSDKEESVHLLDMFTKNTSSNVLEEQWKEFFELKDEIYKLVEQEIKNGTINRVNESKVFIKTDSKFIKSLDLKYLLMVGDFEFSNENKVIKFDSEKCQRCWNHFNKNSLINELCKRCTEVI